MTDNIQKTTLPNGVTTPNIAGLSCLKFNGGLTVSSTTAPKTFNLGGGNIGSYTMPLASGLNIQGQYIVKFYIGSSVTMVMLTASAQAYAGSSANVTNSIVVDSVAHTDTTVCTFRSAAMVKNPIDNSMALTLTFNTNAVGATTANAMVDAIGDPAPVSMDIDLSQWNAAASFSYIDSRDFMIARPVRTGGVGTSLNSLYTPGVVSVNPTDSASRPVGSSGIGTCIVMGSVDSNVKTQLFIDTQIAKVYQRSLGSDGITWGAWAGLIGDSDLTAVLQQNQIITMMDAIVFG